MNQEGEVEFDLGESVLPEEVDDLAVPLPLVALQPWHRPRKQFIRERQWVRCAEMLLDRLRASDAPSLRSGKVNYLTLPGVDYFDVEVIGRLAAERRLDLEALGFMAEAVNEPVKARSQFRSEALVKRGLITDTSVTYPYRVEELARRGGQAYRNARARAPFHIINIDACGSIARPGAQPSTTLMDALFCLLELQFDTMRDPWLLYLTTDVRRETVDPQVKRALDEAIKQNASESDEFCEGVIASVGDPEDELVQALAKADAVPAKLLTKFSLGFAKWLIHNAVQQEWDVKCRPFFCYSTMGEGEQGPSMPCLAFEFRPRPLNLTDVYGVVGAPVDNEEGGLDYSMEALRRSQEMTDVDALLANDALLERDFADRQRGLLQGAGYKEQALREFDERFLGGAE